MPDNRIDLTIAAQNNTRPGVEALNREVAKPRVRVAAESVRVYRDALGRLHEESGKYISRQKVLASGYTIVDGSARKAGEAIGGLNDPLAKTGRGSRGASAGLRVLGQELQITSNIARQFSRVLTSQTRSIITEAANIERLRLGLSTLSPSIAEAEAQYRRLIEVARLARHRLQQCASCELYSCKQLVKLARKRRVSLSLLGTRLPYPAHQPQTYSELFTDSDNLLLTVRFISASLI